MSFIRLVALDGPGGLTRTEPTLLRRPAEFDSFLRIVDGHFKTCKAIVNAKQRLGESGHTGDNHFVPPYDIPPVRSKNVDKKRVPVGLDGAAVERACIVDVHVWGIEIVV